MRTTYTPTPDVEVEIRRLRKDLGIGVSEATNLLARRGIAAAKEPSQQFRQRSTSMRAKIPVADVGVVLENLDHACRSRKANALASAVDADAKDYAVAADWPQRQLLQAPGVTGNLVPDAQLAALAIEHGVAVASADADFARFPGCRWVNPLR